MHKHDEYTTKGLYHLYKLHAWYMNESFRSYYIYVCHSLTILPFAYMIFLCNSLDKWLCNPISIEVILADSLHN